MKLVSHPEKCTGCRICEVVCSIAKERTINPDKARIRVVTAYPGIFDTTVVCRQCTVPPCVTACPVGAISKNGRTGAVLVDSNTCAGCENCLNVCPYSAITMHNYDGKKFSVICDLCAGDPTCVKWCPYNAIELVIKTSK